MKPLRKGLDNILAVLSPLAIIGFVFGAIILITNGIEHYSLVQRLEREGVVNLAKVSYIPNDGDIQVTFTTSDGEERTHFIRRKYYPPELLRQLALGDSVKIRRLAQEWEYDAVWEDHFPAVQGYLGFAAAPGVMVLVCWVVVLVHPEFLYLFWGEEM